ncbi:MAG: hypothetical protein CVV49_06930 [Spirochaetae bacterium HGW-Spirochaetae-5]|nr:MAG: hypothetical protein CVV49_06930 [Spirochaetae bacterium HGW-Spirochaetae-5]
MKYITITFMILLLCADLHAAGIFNLGLMAGAANDAGDVEYITGNINSEMRSIPGAGVTELDASYAPVFSVNLAYINDTLLVKTGLEYSTNSFYYSSGSVKSGGAVNNVKLNYSRFTFPITFGLVIPYSERNRLYFAGGINISQIFMVVKQSNPAGVNLPSYPESSHTFSTYITGTHLKFGAETLLDRNYSFAVEFTKYYGNTKKVQSEDENSEVMMGMNAFEITAGINYSIDFKI